MSKISKQINEQKKIINFNFRGQLINKYISHPVVIFYVGNKVWYLNARSYSKNKKIRTRQIGEIHISYGPNSSLEDSYVDLRSVQIMDRSEFEKLYDPKNVKLASETLPLDQAEKLYSKLYERAKSGNLTIQNVNINQEGKPYNEIIYTHWDKDKLSKIALKQANLDNNSYQAKEALKTLNNKLEDIVNLLQKREVFEVFNNSYDSGEFFKKEHTAYKGQAYNIDEISKVKEELKNQFDTPKNTLKNKH